MLSHKKYNNNIPLLGKISKGTLNQELHAEIYLYINDSPLRPPKNKGAPHS